MATGKKGKGTVKVKNLKSKKVSGSKASQVKGGFNPQPEPPRALSRGSIKVTNPIFKKGW